MDHLKRNDFKEARPWVTMRLKEEYTAEDLIKTIKNTRVRLWKIKQLTIEEVELEVPEMKKQKDIEEDIPF
jgi:hypothetical protein